MKVVESTVPLEAKQLKLLSHFKEYTIFPWLMVKQALEPGERFIRFLNILLQELAVMLGIHLRHIFLAERIPAKGE